jgi:hypothetical protein
MSREIHAYAWDDERPDERPSEFARSTGYGAIHSTQHGGLYSTQHGGLYGTQHGALGPADSGFTRPSRLPRERVKPRRKLRDLPASVVVATILGGAAFLLYEFARMMQR